MVVDGGPTTIALGDPNGMGFSRLYVIRHAIFESGPGESHTNASLAYPYATEHEGCLYVGYSNMVPGVLIIIVRRWRSSPSCSLWTNRYRR